MRSELAELGEIMRKLRLAEKEAEDKIFRLRQQVQQAEALVPAAGTAQGRGTTARGKERERGEQRGVRVKGTRASGQVGGTVKQTTAEDCRGFQALAAAALTTAGATPAVRQPSLSWPRRAAWSPSHTSAVLCSPPPRSATLCKSTT